MTTPQTEPTSLPAHGWTAEKRVRFRERLAHHGNARAAASEVSMSAQTAYRLRRRDGLFARGWNAALLLARDTSAQVLAERAIDGVVEEVWHRGELVGTRRRFDTRLLLAHIGRLDRLADEPRAGQDAGRFDRLLACIAGESVPDELAITGEPVPPERDELVAIVAKTTDAELIDEWREKEVDSETDLEAEHWWAHQAECRQRQAAACGTIGALWDEWATRAEAAVDALIGGDEATTMPGLPGNPLAAASPAPADSPPEQCNPRNPGPLKAALDLAARRTG